MWQYIIVYENGSNWKAESDNPQEVIEAYSFFSDKIEKILWRKIS